MELYRKTMRYFFALFSFVVFTLTASCSFAVFFPKIVFLEPPSGTPSERMSYLAQIDSSGANTVVGVDLADSVGTHNPYNLKFLGQDNRLKIPGASNDIQYYVQRGHKVYLEAEVIQYDSTNGYLFGFTTGDNREDPDASGGQARLGIAGTHPAGYLIYNLTGVKAYLRSERIIRSYFKLKVSDNSSSDTVCALEIWAGGGLKALRGLRPHDFTASNTYQTFNVQDVWVTGGQNIDYRVRWYGNHDLWVDQVSADDDFARELLSYNPNDVTNAFAAYYQRVNADNHLRFYPADEPMPMQYYLIKWFDTYSKSVPPAHQSSDIITYHADYPAVYVADIQPQELFLDYYPLGANVDSASQGANNLQTALNSMTSALRRYSQIAYANSTNFWAMVQVHAEKTCSGTLVSRDPQVNEIKAQVWLSLAYGAKGIGYFLYPTYYCTGEREWPQCLDWPIDSSKIDPAQWNLHGLVDKNPTTGWYDPNYKWYAVKDVNSRMDSLASTLLTLNWQGAGVCYNVTSISGSFINTVKSAEFDSAWIEAGFFKDGSNADYFMLVNRRCLSTEAQNVTLYIDSAKIGNKKMWYAIDQYSHDTTFTGAINGNVPLTTHLDPGEGKLFKLMAFQDSAFHASAHPLTWQGGIMIDGDVTVDSGKTLFIQPPAKITFYANIDVMKTWDTTDCGFVVYGGLRAVGTESDSIILTSTEGNPDDWESILVLTMDSCSNAVLSYCVVENAYIGLALWNSYPDTVTHCRFHNNKYAGVFAQFANRVLVASNHVFGDSISDENFITGIDICPNTPSKIHNNLVENYHTGMYVGADSIDIYQGSINNAWVGVEAFGCKKLRIEDVNVLGILEDCGFDFCNSNAEIIHCKVMPNSENPVPIGIYFSDDINADDIYYVRTCEIKNFSEAGIYLGYPGKLKPDLGTLNSHGNNKIYSDLGYLVSSVGKRATDSVYAQYNWWGEYPPDPTRFSRSIIYMPALEFEPEEPDSEQAKVAVFGGVPEKFELSHNYPNPFNPVTTIHFTLGKAPSLVHTTLKIYNILGQLVKTLVDEEKAEGSYTIYWDGRSDDGKTVSSGIYFYKLEADEFADVKKMVLLR